MSRREWDTPVREPWNPVIHHLLKAIDLHTREYLKTGDRWHAENANALRKYVAELKDRIQAAERQ
jgi:hypothetical protein